MLRKISVLLVLLVLVVFLAAGCSSKGSKNDGDAAPQEVATPAETVEKPEEETSAPAQEETAETNAEETVETASEDEVYEEVDRSQYENPSTLTEKFSYAFGVYVADYYGLDYATYYYYMYQAQVYPELDAYFGSLGIYDYMMGDLLYSVDELNQIFNDYFADYDIRMAALADTNLAKAEAFLAENATKSGIYTTESGLQYEIVRQGDGALAQATDSVELDYELKLMDGTIIDSSYARGEHSTFPLSGVIAGFREGVMLMPMGSHYIFYIHPNLGYGDQATGSMEPNSLLIFNVETYSIQGE